MTSVALTDEALSDLERLEEFLARAGDPLADRLLDFVLDAVQVLTHQPGIGRPAGRVPGIPGARGYRELIISRRRSGYLAKYHYDEVSDSVYVLRLRHQRESGYSAEEI